MLKIKENPVFSPVKRQNICSLISTLRKLPICSTRSFWGMSPAAALTSKVTITPSARPFSPILPSPSHRHSPWSVWVVSASQLVPSVDTFKHPDYCFKIRGIRSRSTSSGGLLPFVLWSAPSGRGGVGPDGIFRGARYRTDEASLTGEEMHSGKKQDEVAFPILRHASPTDIMKRSAPEWKTAWDTVKCIKEVSDKSLEQETSGNDDGAAY